ncbi:MSMEG_0567/Sll0786 family nitrogen starvation N-acetyltransferase [Thalassolituus oleivorans]|uniref:MSMEG_0567/Sll0786 family nitrogen starvation N-acetyltransferase n=1 Tax=Thalassolituus oleivorans TaxID=187493 RepID=UPI0030C7C8CE
MSYLDYSDYTIKWATLPWEIDQAMALRRRVFCDEQGIFAADDRDSIDDRAHILVALGNNGGWHDQVLGTVRIHQEGEHLWYGSRLAVESEFRSHDQLGKMLIKLAVSSAHALGCECFMALVQQQNEILFQRLNWQIRGYREKFGLSHALMEADLNAYPPCHTPNSGFVLKARKQNKHEVFWPGLFDMPVPLTNASAITQDVLR